MACARSVHAPILRPASVAACADRSAAADGADDLEPVAGAIGVSRSGCAARSRRSSRRRSACPRGPVPRRRRRRPSCASRDIACLHPLTISAWPTRQRPVARSASRMNASCRAKRVQARTGARCRRSFSRSPRDERPILAPATGAGSPPCRTACASAGAKHRWLRAPLSARAGSANQFCSRHWRSDILRPVQDDPQVIRRDRQFLTDFLGFELHAPRAS